MGFAVLQWMLWVCAGNGGKAMHVGCAPELESTLGQDHYSATRVAVERKAVFP